MKPGGQRRFARAFAQYAADPDKFMGFRKLGDKIHRVTLGVIGLRAPSAERFETLMQHPVLDNCDAQ